MRVNELAVGMEVKCTNMFNLTYKIVKKNKTTLWLEHYTGNTIMRGGKRINEIFTYKNVRSHQIKKLITKEEK